MPVKLQHPMSTTTHTSPVSAPCDSSSFSAFDSSEFESAVAYCSKSDLFRSWNPDLIRFISWADGGDEILMATYRRLSAETESFKILFTTLLYSVAESGLYDDFTLGEVMLLVDEQAQQGPPNPAGCGQALGVLPSPAGSGNSATKRLYDRMRSQETREVRSLVRAMFSRILSNEPAVVPEPTHPFVVRCVKRIMARVRRSALDDESRAIAMTTPFAMPFPGDDVVRAAFEGKPMKKRSRRSSDERFVRFVVKRAFSRVDRRAGSDASSQSTETVERVNNRGSRALYKIQHIVDVALQSGGVGPNCESPAQAKAARRQAREEQQRRAAQREDRYVKARISKELREYEISKQRGRRVPVYEDVDSQSGPLNVGAAVVGAVAINQLFRLFGKVGSVLGKADSLLDKSSAVFKQFENVKNALVSQFSATMWSVPFILTAYFSLKYFRFFGTPAGATIITIVASFVGPKMWSHAAEFFRGGGVEDPSVSDVKVQSGLLETAPKLLASLMAFSVLGRKSPSMISEFCKRISMLDRISSGWEVFLRWLCDAMQGVINYVRCCFGKDKIVMFKSIHKPTYEWANKVDAYATAMETGKMDADPRVLNELIRLVETGNGFKAAYSHTSMARFVDNYVVKATNLLAPHLGALNARKNFRFEPVMIMLLGKPGIGKTVLSTYFCSSLLTLSGVVPAGASSDDIAAEIWQKGTSEYWNSYSQQACVVMDDALQQRADSSDKDNEYMNIIRMVGSWAMPLNFADLTSKGKIFFTSKVLFGTTNVSSILSEASIVLQKPDAVTRRITYPYEIVINSEFATQEGFLDKAKFDAECARCFQTQSGVDRFPWYIWKCHRHDFATGATNRTSSIPLRDLLMQVASDLKERLRVHELTKDYLSSFMSGLSSTGEPPQTRDGCDRADVDVQAGLPRFVGKSSCTLKEFSCALRAHVDEYVSTHKRVERILRCGAYALGVTAAFVVLKGILTTAWNLLTTLFGRGAAKRRPKGSVAPQSNRPLVAKAQRVRVDDVRIQSGDPIVIQNVYNNSYKMFVQLGDQVSSFGQIVFLTGSLAVQPEHFSARMREMLAVQEIRSDSKVVLRSCENAQHSYELSVARYLGFKRISDADADVEFVNFTDVRAHRNVVGSFMKEVDLPSIRGKRGRLDICEIDSKGRLTRTNNRWIQTFPSFVYDVVPFSFNGRRLTRHFSYEADTDVGDCGAPVSIADNTCYSGRTVMGLHVAGSSLRRRGYANVVTQEMIKDAILAMEVIVDRFDEDLTDRGLQIQSGGKIPFDTPGSFLYIGQVNRPAVICPRTSYYVTHHYGVLGDYKCLPAPLSPVFRDGELVFPMVNAVKPYSSPVRIYEQPFLRLALNCAMRPFTILTRDRDRSIFTFEQSVCGIPSEKFRSIPRGTSPGYPYVLDMKDGKKGFFGSSQSYDLDTEEALSLRKRVEYIEDCARKNERLSHVFLDFLKDELRSEAKVEAVATRLISSSPLDYTVSFRKWYGAFCSAAMSVYVKSGMACGINVYSDWDELAQHLHKKGDSIFAGDFKAFDSSEQPVLLDMILDFINAWYDDGSENARVRTVLWQELVHSRHLGGLGKDQSHVYQWNKSLPSGHPMTTIVNSIYSLTLLVAVYMSDTGDLTGFWDHVSPIVYGDDNACNVSPERVDVFNQTTVAIAMKREFDLVYTSDVKDGDLGTVTTLDKITFLKRSFYLEDHFWLAPLELDSFLYTFYWCKNRKLEREILVDNMEFCLQELSLHPRAKWDEYAARIYKLLFDSGVAPKAACDRDQYQLIVKSRRDNWY